MKTTIADFKGYILNGQFFKTKDDVCQKIRDILHSYSMGSRVSEDDAKFLLDLLCNHPSADSKIGTGVEAFEIRQNPRFTKSRCFYLIRIDGSEEDFSYTKCLYPPTSLAIFKNICRKLVGIQLFWLKSACFRKNANEDRRIQCPITGEWVTEDQAHVDHIPPDTFEKLVTDFIAQNNINVEEVEIREAEGDAEIGKTFTDASLAEEWIKYHNENAKLRVVSSYANLSIIGRQTSAERKESYKNLRLDINKQLGKIKQMRMQLEESNE